MGRQTSADFPLPIDVFADIAPAIATEDMESVREFGTHRNHPAWAAGYQVPLWR